MVSLLESLQRKINVRATFHVDLSLYGNLFSSVQKLNRDEQLVIDSHLPLYNDLPSYRRGGDSRSWLFGEQDPFSKWYNSKGSEVDVYILSEVWDWLMWNFYEYGKGKDVGALLAGYSISPRSVGITDIAILTEGDRSSSGMVGSEEKVMEAMKHLRENIHDFEYGLGLSPGIKRLVGGGHTHPCQRIYLSPIDVENMRVWYEFAKKHPELYAASGGNLEMVVNPNDGKIGGFKLGAGGYEEVPISIVLKYSAMPRPMA